MSLYLSWNSALGVKKFVPAQILKQLSHQRLIPALSQLSGGSQPCLGCRGELWSRIWSSLAGLSNGKLPKLPPAMRFPKERLQDCTAQSAGIGQQGRKGIKDWSIDWKTSPNSNHLWVKITSNTWKLYSDKMNFWQSFHSYFKGEKCEAKGKSESFWNNFNGTLWREPLSDLTIST